MTNDDKVATQIRKARDHGRASKYTHDFVGWNLRFNELQAAAGRVMLKHLTPGNARRREIAKLYSERLANIVKVPPVRDWAEHVFHMYVIRHPRRDALAKFLQENGIGTGIHYPIPVHMQPAYADPAYREGDFPHSERAANEVLSLPMYAELSFTQVEMIGAAVKEQAYVL